MTTILLVENNPPNLVSRGLRGAEGFERSFAQLSFDVTVTEVAPYERVLTAVDLEAADGVVFSGTSAHVGWGVADAEAAPLRAAMELCFANGKPVWGSCNGMQLGAVVLGGEVGASPQGIEFGIARDILPTKNGMAHPMLNGRSAGYVAPCVHFHEVLTVAAGTEILAGNIHSPIQAIAHSGAEQFWGTQYHPELTLADIALFAAGTTYGEDAETMALLRRADSDRDAARALGAPAGVLPDPLCELRNWLAHVRASA